MGNAIRTRLHPSQEEQRTRIIVPNHLLKDEASNPNNRYSTNYINTTKYTWWNFLPKNVYEQMHRLANIYFLFIVILNFVPIVTAVNKWLAITPLLFVLSVTGVKDVYEDYRRYITDKEVNHEPCRVYSRLDRRYVAKEWQEIRVGDIVHLSCNEVVSADLVLLRSSDRHGLCHIDTSSLDGESNLKQKQIVRHLQQGEEFHPTMFTHVIECERPSMDVYKFHGTMTSQLGEKIPISLSNLLMRGCVVRNTDYVEGVVVYAGHDTKVLLNNQGPRLKRSKVERHINRDVLLCVLVLFILCLMSSLGAGIFQAHYNSLNVTIPFIPYEHESMYSPTYLAFLRFWRFIIVYQAVIPLSMYVTVEVVKLGQVFFIHCDQLLRDQKSKKRVICRALNITEDLGQIEHIFSDKTGTLTENRMVFKKCSVAGVNYKYTKQHEEADLRASEASLHRESSQIKIFQPGGFEKKGLEEQDEEEGNEDLTEEFIRGNTVVEDFLLALAVCNTVVINESAHHDELDASGNMVDDPRPVSNQSQTKNSSCGKSENLRDRVRNKLKSVPKFMSRVQYKRWTDNVSLPCSSSPSTTSLQHLSLEDAMKHCYEADSPDEMALVKAACSYKCVLKERTVDKLVIQLPDNSEKVFHLLHTLHFDPFRKRQSVVVQDSVTQEIVLFSKGADSAVFNQLASGQDPQFLKITKDHLTSYAQNGLRTLCVAKKILTQVVYNEWLESHHQAVNSIHDRDKLLYESSCRIETNLTLLGATGIEDRLQEHVPRTISALRDAGINMWVLTGDKQETAISIAYASELIGAHHKLLLLNASSVVETGHLLTSYLQDLEVVEPESDLYSVSQTSQDQLFNMSANFSSHNNSVNMNNSGSQNGRLTPLKRLFRLTQHNSTERLRSDNALVVDGATLNFIVEGHLQEQFLELAERCSSVTCVRATPFQKATLVSMVKKYLQKQTLAIGDGGNDVSMLQTADVGVGISGHEGMQAVMAADFALPRFHFLRRMLLLHGHWCYDRLSRLVHYLWYKNIMFVSVTLLIQVFSGFTGGYPYHDFNLLFFNLFFTSLPPIFFGVWEQNIPEHMLEAVPGLYCLGRTDQIYTKFSILRVISLGIFEGIVAFFIPYAVYNDSCYSFWEFGVTAYTGIVWTQLAHIAVTIHNWNMTQVASIVLSLISYYTISLMVNFACHTCSFPSETYQVFVTTLGSAEHWFSVLLVVIVASVPRIVAKTLLGTFRADLSTQARYAAKSTKKSAYQVVWSIPEEGTSVA